MLLGYVRGINANKCAQICQDLGAGRTFAGQDLDLAVGLNLRVEIGDKVKEGLSLNLFSLRLPASMFIFALCLAFVRFMLKFLLQAIRGFVYITTERLKRRR